MKLTRLGALRAVAAAVVVACGAGTVQAQSVPFAGREVQVHGSFQQAWVVTDGNNFLTTNSNEGSGEFTDAAFNASTQVNRKLRVGAQIYSRNIGQLGNGQFQFDWAYADYRVSPAFGVRAGKIKTALGLFNDTQDMEFLHTWALLPQGVYPLDLRSVTIAHVGADVYGYVGMGPAGGLQYTAYYGSVPDDTNGGYRYGVEDNGTLFTQPIESVARGGDVRWSTPVDGLSVGTSAYQMDLETQVSLGPGFGPMQGLLMDVDIPDWKRYAVFGDFQRGDARVSAEWRREGRVQNYELLVAPALSPAPSDIQSGSYFVSGAYRVHERVELGAYYTTYVADRQVDKSLDNNHISTLAISGRYDITPFWNVKVEGHFIDGYGNTTYARGFYRRVNAGGLTPETTMLVVRTGVNF